MECGCDSQACNRSILNYIRRKLGTDSVFTDEFTFWCSEAHGRVHVQGQFSPFSNLCSGIWGGVIVDRGHRVFGMEYEKGHECGHIRDRANFVRLVKFYLKTLSTYDSIKGILPLPIEEELLPELPVFRYTFNDVSLPDRIIDNPTLYVKWDKDYIRLTKTKAWHSGSIVYLTRRYMEIDDVYYETSIPVLQKWLNEPLDTNMNFDQFIVWLINRPFTCIKRRK